MQSRAHQKLAKLSAKVSGPLTYSLFSKTQPLSQKMCADARSVSVPFETLRPNNDIKADSTPVKINITSAP